MRESNRFCIFNIVGFVILILQQQKVYQIGSDYTLHDEMHSKDGIQLETVKIKGGWQ